MGSTFRTFGATLFGIGAGALIGGLWLGTAAWFDPQPGFFTTRTSHSILGIIYGLVYGSIGGGLLSLVIMTTRVYARKAISIGALIGVLAVCAVAYFYEDPSYILTSLVLIVGGGLIGWGTARLLGR